ncbi:MAG: SPFH domain-containing protein, partial [Planctomycetota bacterium]
MNNSSPEMDGGSDSSNDFKPPNVPPRPPKENQFSLVEAIRSGSRMIGWLVLGLFVLFWCSGITTVGPGEVALVLRFGELTGSSQAEQVRQPGLLLALPFPIDEVIRVPVKQEREVVLSALRSESSARGISKQILPGYALSGNQNIIEADMTLKYRIKDPVAFKFYKKK